MVDFPENGHVQSGRRPAVVVQGDVANLYAPTCTVIPLTKRTWKAKYMPTHALIRKTKENGLRFDSSSLGENIGTVDKSCFLEKIGTISEEDYYAVMKGVYAHLDVDVEVRSVPA